MQIYLKMQKKHLKIAIRFLHIHSRIFTTDVNPLYVENLWPWLLLILQSNKATQNKPKKINLCRKCVSKNSAESRALWSRAHTQTNIKIANMISIGFWCVFHTKFVKANCQKLVKDIIYQRVFTQYCEFVNTSSTILFIIL